MCQEWTEPYYFAILVNRANFYMVEKKKNWQKVKKEKPREASPTTRWSWEILGSYANP